jgi:hypothetical protein
MATRVVYTVVDDLDASTDNVGRYRFPLDGIEYEIDLSAPNLSRLHAALAPFITAGRRLPTHKTTARRTAASASDAPRIRRWWAATTDRLDLPAYRRHGSIPAQVRQAYHAAH